MVNSPSLTSPIFTPVIFVYSIGSGLLYPITAICPSRSFECFNNSIDPIGFPVQSAIRTSSIRPIDFVDICRATIARLLPQCPVTIGRPNTSMRVYILNHQYQLAPLRRIGEIGW